MSENPDILRQVPFISQFALSAWLNLHTVIQASDKHKQTTIFFSHTGSRFGPSYSKSPDQSVSEPIAIY